MTSSMGAPMSTTQDGTRMPFAPPICTDWVELSSAVQKARTQHEPRRTTTQESARSIGGDGSTEQAPGRLPFCPSVEVLCDDRCSI